MQAVSKTLLQQNLPVPNWEWRLTQVVLYDGHKMVVVALFFYLFVMVTLCNKADHYIFAL